MTPKKIWKEPEMEIEKKRNNLIKNKWPSGPLGKKNFLRMIEGMNYCMDDWRFNAPYKDITQ